ncbi:Zn-ribbon domain-containing OB-fold protein [Luminiphilus sp. nBUS_16]|uniref:Zn-ribbon domain-containing OB-fold protein n=1 Tax=Luminiphilus sp. nBUS_16 TaxID=3395315 RepID=UPI003EC00DAE
MNIKDKMRKRLKLGRPSLRARARPPKHRSVCGSQFSAVNLPGILQLQNCTDCGHVQYPPTELCGACLGSTLIYRDTPCTGTLLAQSQLHHSLWEYFKRRIKEAPWTIASVQLDVGPVAIVHLAAGDLKTGNRVQVFSHSDASRSVVLIAVPASADITTPALRQAIIATIQLDQPAKRQQGI